jgi:hypothetical protein
MAIRTVCFMGTIVPLSDTFATENTTAYLVYNHAGDSERQTDTECKQRLVFFCPTIYCTRLIGFTFGDKQYLAKGLPVQNGG